MGAVPTPVATSIQHDDTSAGATLRHLEPLALRHRHNEQHQVLQVIGVSGTSCRHISIGLTKSLAPRQGRQFSTRIADGSRGQYLQQVAEADQRSCLAPATGRSEEDGQALRRRPTTPENVPLAAIIDVGPVEVPNPVVGQTGPLADRMGPGLVRDHAQRQVVALEIAVIAFPPYTHCNMLRRSRPLCSKGMT